MCDSMGSACIQSVSQPSTGPPRAVMFGWPLALQSNSPPLDFPPLSLPAVRRGRAFEVPETSGETQAAIRTHRRVGYSRGFADPVRSGRDGTRTQPNIPAATPHGVP
jgi:hypothetical protein